jgi:peptidoglycan-N-acetylglucosamine deacetylase
VLRNKKLKILTTILIVSVVIIVIIYREIRIIHPSTDTQVPVLLNHPTGLKKLPEPKIITHLPAADSVIALTFDACETRTPAFFDTALLIFIIRNKIPATFFISGLFAERNRKLIALISWLPFIDIANHSYKHYQHMERLGASEFTNDITGNERLLKTLTGRQPRFFRFPGGNCDKRSLQLISSLGYKTVHWSFASGDADSMISAKRLKQWILEKSKPGGILIFHINRRGYHTAEILPSLVESLKAAGYRFVLLKDYL